MSAVGTYPGVYINEVSSGVHTITDVATSIAAFIGWAPQGPTDEAVLVESFSEFQSIFGSFVPTVYLAYCVNHFFQNGGQQAYIIRLVASKADTPAATIMADTAQATWTDGTTKIYAANPGGWGNNLVVTITPQPVNANRFGLLVQQPNSTGNLATLESYANLSCTSTDPQYVVTVIDADSSYITFIAPGTTTPPATSPGTPGAATIIKFSADNTGADGDILLPGAIVLPQNFELALGSSTGGVGMNLLNNVPIFNLLCVPGETDAVTIGALQTLCMNNRAFLIVDAPSNASVGSTATYSLLNGPLGTSTAGAKSLPGSGPAPTYSAYYFPWVLAPDPVFGNRPALFPPCGAVAGIYAATDGSRGVWKAPAGLDANVTQVLGLATVLNDQQNGLLNPNAVNCLRQFRTAGNVVWGTRTLAGADATGSQWKYVPIRRLALFIESSLYDGTQWVVFEPNDEPLWGQIRLNIGAFMQDLFLKGAFQGTTPQQAYFVKCDSENNFQSSIDQGIVNILVGFAPLYPAEFVVIQIQQVAGQLLT